MLLLLPLWGVDRGSVVKFGRGPLVKVTEVCSGGEDFGWSSVMLILIGEDVT